MSTVTAESAPPTGVRAPRSLRGWRGLAATGAALVIAMVLTVHAVVRAPIPPLLVFAVLAAVVIALLWRGPVRAGAVLALLMGLFFLADLPRTFVGLRLVGDPFEFTISVVGLVAPLALVAGGIAVLVRGAGAGAGSRLPRALSAAAVVVVVAALALSSTLRLTAGEATAQDGDVAVATREYQFAPQELRATAGEVAFFVENADPTGHTFTVEGTAVDVAVSGGAAARTTAELAAGEYRYVCRVTGHEMMEGTLVVEPS